MAIRKEKINKFVDTMLKTGDRIQAIKTTNPMMTQESAHTKACLWMQKPEVIEALKQRLAKADFTFLDDKFILDRIYELIMDNKTKDSTKAVLIGLLARIRKLDQPDMGNQNIAIFGDDIKEYLSSKRADKIGVMPKEQVIEAEVQKPDIPVATDYDIPNTEPLT